MGEDSGEAQSLSERPRRPPARRYAAPETRYRRVRIALQQYHGIAGLQVRRSESRPRLCVI